MSNFWFMYECAYCGITARYPADLEFRNGKIVCRDITACDRRDAAANPEEDW